MFGRSKKQVTYKTEVIENVIGVGLPNRNKFMNYGDVSADNIYSGYAIGRVFSEDKDRLSFEFDAVYLSYLIKGLTKIGIPAEQSSEALKDVFDNFELAKVECDKFYQRLEDYISLSDTDVAEKFINNLNVSDFPENFREPSRKILGEQFHALSLSVTKFAKNQLGAAR